jgi:DNA-binding response OmpR family regulator
MAERRRPRVLVVDDERTFTELLATFLEDEGYEVDRAYDGEQALQALQVDELPDLVLSDVMLPKLKGTELLALARRRFPAERLPFILLSAGLDPGVRDACASFMAKPLDLDQLLDRVELLMLERRPITTP